MSVNPTTRTSRWYKYDWKKINTYLERLNLYSFILQLSQNTISLLYLKRQWSRLLSQAALEV